MDKMDTLTDTVAVSLISNYLAMKQSGSLDADSAQKLIDQTLSYANQNTQTTLYTQKDLDVIADNGNTSITNYGESRK